MKKYFLKSIIFALSFFLYIEFSFSQINGKEVIKDTVFTNIQPNSDRLNKENKFLENGTEGLDSLSLEEKKLFGYSLFQNKGIEFAPSLNMATPKNYIVGPGDVIIAQIYGLAQKSYELKINNEGKVRIEDIGIVSLSGLSINSVNALLKEKFSIRYAGLKNTNPTVFLDISLGEIRSISVNLIGEIKKPGTFIFPSYTTVFNALYSAGGPTLNGTFRNVQVFRLGKLLTQFDLYDFLVKGYKDDDIRLEDNDVILVKPADLKVEVSGEVVRPGIYELKEGESVSDLIRFFSGFSESGLLGKINVERKDQQGIKILDVEEKDFLNFSLKNGDFLRVNSIPDQFINRVQITGAINNPGAFELFEGMSVFDLIEKAGGLKRDAFLDNVFLYRSMDDYSQTLTSIDLNDVELVKSIKLQKEDVIQIKNITEVNPFLYLHISGEINSPGIFPFSSEISLKDLILKAGGFKFPETIHSIEIVRKEKLGESNFKIISISSSDKLENFNLKPFDNIFIRQSNFEPFPSSVLVTGEVNFEGEYILDNKEMKVSDLISRSGGLTKYAYPKGASLLRKSSDSKVISQNEKELDILTRLLNEIKSDSTISRSEINKDIVKGLSSKIETLQEGLYFEKQKDIELQKINQITLQNENKINSSSITKKSDSGILDDLLVIDLEKIVLAPGGPDDLLLRNGDILNIPEKLETVKIDGGVLYPLSIKFDEKFNYMDYVRGAGGYDRKAIKNKGYVVLPNGRIKPVASFLALNFYPKVEPGSEIFIPSNPIERPPFNYAQTVQTVTGLITSTLTLIFLFRSF
jgi:protein involved in polysaccharide export with SLBB domain